jgi:hypothetical protein
MTYWWESVRDLLPLRQVAHGCERKGLLPVGMGRLERMPEGDFLHAAAASPGGTATGIALAEVEALPSSR